MCDQFCAECPYKADSPKIMGSSGPLDAQIVVVGEGATPLDYARNEPLAGGAKSFLTQVFDSLGMIEEFGEPLYIHALNCFPKDNKSSDKQKGEGKGNGGKNKYKKATTLCTSSLEAKIKQHPRKLVISLGAGPMHMFTGNNKLKILNERGTLMDSRTDLAEHGVLICVGSRYMLSGAGSVKQFRSDIEFGLSAVRGLETKLYKAPTYEIFNTDDHIKYQHLVKKLEQHGQNIVGADIETGGFDFWRDEVLELGVTLDGKHVYIIPPELIDNQLFNNNTKWVWHNGKFDIKFLWYLGATKARVDEDTMLMSYVLDELKGIHGLEQVGWDWLRAPDYKHMIKPYLPNKKTSYREIPVDIRRKYCATDVALTYQLHAPLSAAVQANALCHLNYTKVLIPASAYLTEIEWNGIQVDLEWVKKYEREMSSELAYLNRVFQGYAILYTGNEVNTNSPAQLKNFLYKKMGLGHPHQSTDRKTLSRLPEHPVINTLLKIRKIQKRYSTYIIPLLTKVDENGRIHATYKIHGTVTGRLASSDPNMQNMPRFSAVRGSFAVSVCKHTGRKKVMLECDLSQAELRSLAELSGDEELLRIMSDSSISLHDEVSGDIFPQYNSPDLPAFTGRLSRGSTYSVPYVEKNGVYCMQRYGVWRPN